MSARYRRVQRDGVTVLLGRPDLHGDPDFGVTFAKTFPPWVFGTSRMAALVHRVAEVRLHWWELVDCGHAMARVNRPRATARTLCGQMFFLEARRARTCLVPKSDALLCGRCLGQGPRFGPRGSATRLGLTKAAASVRLGCVVNGYGGDR